MQNILLNWDQFTDDGNVVYHDYRSCCRAENSFQEEGIADQTKTMATPPRQDDSAHVYQFEIV